MHFYQVFLQHFHYPINISLLLISLLDLVQLINEDIAALCAEAPSYGSSVLSEKPFSFLIINPSSYRFLINEKVLFSTNDESINKRLLEVLEENSYRVELTDLIEKVFGYAGLGAIVEYLINGKTVIDYIIGEFVLITEGTGTQATGIITVKEIQKESSDTSTKINSKDQVKDLVDQLNKAMAPMNTNLKLGVDSQDVFYVSVIESQTANITVVFTLTAHDGN